MVTVPTILSGRVAWNWWTQHNVRYNNNLLENDKFCIISESESFEGREWRELSGREILNDKSLEIALNDSGNRKVTFQNRVLESLSDLELI